MARKRSASQKKTAVVREPGRVADAPAAVEVAEVVEPSGPPPVVIELDPGVSGGYVHNRFDVALRGRAISEAPVDEVRLQVGETVISTASFGQHDRAPQGVLPDGRPARARAFQFNLPCRNDEVPTRKAFQVIARAEEGTETEAAFEIEVDPAAADVVTIAAGPTRAGILVGNVRPHAVMYIERATLDPDGLLSVVGWAIALGPILAVQIYAGEERLGKARLGGERDDVAAAYPAYPNARLAGFSLTTQLEPEEREASTVRALVVCPNGFGHQETIPIERLARRAPARPPAPPVAEAAEQAGMPAPLPSFSLINQRPSYQLRAEFRIEEEPLIGLMLAPPPAPAPPPVAEAPPAAVLAPPPPPSTDIKMFCDTAELSGDGSMLVSGWAVCAAGIAQVRVLVDNEEVGLAAFGHDRPDVGNAFRDIPMAHLSGFKFQQRVRDQFDGAYTVRVIVRNGANEEAEQILNAVAAPLPVAPPPPEPAAAEPEPAPEEAEEFRFQLDAPKLIDGASTEIVSGRLTIDGWLLTRSGIESFDVLLDGQRLGEAHYGQARQDVGVAFPDWPNALRSGFAFHCPPRSLRDGDHTVTLRIRSKDGVEMVRSFGITVRKAEDQQDQTSIRRRVPRVETDMMTGFLADLAYCPRFHFILRQDSEIDVDRLSRTLDALRLQAYADWTMTLLATDQDVATALHAAIKEVVPFLAGRLTVLSPVDEASWNAPLAPAGYGRMLLHALLLPGDEIGADALFEIAVAAGRTPAAGIVYGDEVRTSPVTQERESFFKPDWSPDLLHATNYLGRPWAVTNEVLEQVGATPASLLACGEYDLVLRCAEVAGAVQHVPKLLCQRAVASLDPPSQEQAALERMRARLDIDGEVLPTPVAGTWRLKRTVRTSGMVSIIIPTCAASGYIGTCIESLRARTTYRNYEIIVIDNIPDSEPHWKRWVQENADKVVDIPAAFNWSVFNNRAAEVAEGEFLLFLNDDITLTQDDWLEALLEHAERPEVGIVGPQLLYPDGKVQHAGMFLANNGIGRHAFRFAAADDPCYFGLALTQRNVMAVTGACMLIRRELFVSLGGFEEAHQITNNDLDFCLRVHQAGYRAVFTPYATMNHHELASRARMKDVFDLTHFNAAWKTTFAAGDPYFNLRLSRHADDYRPDEEPTQWVVSGTPLFHVEEIRRILVVKLDHIGDFVTALTPIRRLKTIFPHAHITVLAGPASRAFIALEPSIDAFIPFAFFHARSQLGERALEAADYAALAQELRPHRFDLAIDLRKHPSTRDVLKYTGARFLAGFDYLGQHPNLDVALDWDGDRTLQRKRSHIVTDLMSLVNAVGHATEDDRTIMKPGPEAMPLEELPDAVQALFDKPVVAVHPGAGNVTKQWPEEHFSALIDLLAERNGVNIMLVGGADEVAVADWLLKNVLHAGSVASMAGKTSLADLPRLLKNCVLYIGNDSGPKHIAAAIGLPTIGIHSGVVDPVEWGPIGPNAVALRRNMTCSPCYLAKAEDCPRELACLRFLEPNHVYETADLMLVARQPVDAAAKPVQETVAEQQPHAAEPV